MRYPGRVCLLGEHCDWAVGSSLAVPVPLAIRVEAQEGPSPDRVTLDTYLHGEHFSGSWALSGAAEAHEGPLRFVPAALVALSARSLTPPPTALKVTTDLPPGRGFSSSAAFTLGILDALARRAGQQLSPADLAEMAFHVEHDLLGVPCGRLDPIACAAGAPVFVRWQGGGHEARWVAPGGDLHLVVLAFAAPRDTKAILRALNGHFYDRAGEPDVGLGHEVRAAVAAFGSAAEDGVDALESGDSAALGRAMNEAQRAYNDHLEDRLPELRAPLMRATCSRLVNEGALGAKFSGAGGDGSVVALYGGRQEAIQSAKRLEKGGLGMAFYTPILEARSRDRP